MSAVLIGEVLALAMFALTILAVLIGYPVAFTLAGTALIFAMIGGRGRFDWRFSRRSPDATAAS